MTTHHAHPSPTRPCTHASKRSFQTPLQAMKQMKERALAAAQRSKARADMDDDGPAWGKAKAKPVQANLAKACLSPIRS